MGLDFKEPRQLSSSDHGQLQVTESVQCETWVNGCLLHEAKQHKLRQPGSHRSESSSPLPVQPVAFIIPHDYACTGKRTHSKLPTLETSKKFPRPLGAVKAAKTYPVLPKPNSPVLQSATGELSEQEMRRKGQEEGCATGPRMIHLTGFRHSANLCREDALLGSDSKLGPRKIHLTGFRHSAALCSEDALGGVRAKCHKGLATQAK